MDKLPQKKHPHKSNDAFSRIKSVVHEPLFEILEAYEEDKSNIKFNLIPGPYSDAPNKAYIFDIAQKAQKEVIEANLDKDYIHMLGDPQLLEESKKLIFGEQLNSLKEKILTAETVSASNAMRIILEFFKQFVESDVYIPNISWVNHTNIPQKVGLGTKTYPYLDLKAKKFDFEGMSKTLKSLPPGSIIILHASAYNPAGVEPTPDQWKILANIFKDKGFFAVFDCPAQGLISGDVAKDLTSIQTFLKEDAQVIVCQDLASSMGVYGERIGILHVVCRSAEVAAKVLEQLKLILRTMHSNPPCNGGWIVLKILSKPEYRNQWENELKKIGKKWKQLRKEIYDELKHLGEEGQWEYLVDQEGPFLNIDFTRKQRNLLLNKYHVYITENGSISLENVRLEDVKYITEAFKAALAIPSSLF